jgi:hypothetical protein
MSKAYRNGNFTLIKVGDKDRPATQEDVDDVREAVRKAKDDKDLSLVTHHAIKFDQIKTYEGTATVYKIGSPDRPATSEDIEDFKEELENALKEKRPVIWAHAVEVDYVKLNQNE